MALPLAHIDGKYEIVTKIKEGGMGTVYKVRHRLLDEIRVIKALRSQYKDDTALRGRFIQEARAAIRLRHPNIVQIFDFHIDPEGVGFIVMEYIQGIDLGRLLANHPSLPLSLTLELARQSLRALGYLHRQGFVHRDFSPDNLMLSRDVEGNPLIKLIDLGIAKDLESQSDLTASGTFLGKFRYSSPEHFGSEGPGGIEPRSDLYCFGLVLYQLLTGKYPFEAESTSQLIAAHLFNEPLSFAVTDTEGSVPAPLQELTLALLAKKTDQRPASAEVIIDRLLQAQRQIPFDQADWETLDRLISTDPPANTDTTTPGSTQNRLDIGFQPERTPPPDHLAGPAPAKLARAADSAKSQRFNEHLTAALGLSDAGDFRGALRELEKAQTLQPRNRTLRPLIAEARGNRKQQKEAARAKEQEERRQATIQEVLNQVRTLLQDGKQSDAEQHLRAAEERLGPEPEFDSLRASWRRRKEEKIQQLMQEAGVAWEAGNFTAVAHFLQSALELQPENAWIRARLSQAEAKLQSADPPAVDSQHTVKIPISLLSEAKTQVDAQTLLEQAENALGKEDSLKARILVAEALNLAPDNAEARALAKELDRRGAVGVQSDAVGRTILKAQALRLQEGPLAAWKALQEAMRSLPSSERLDTLQAELAKEVLGGGA